MSECPDGTFNAGKWWFVGDLSITDEKHGNLTEKQLTALKTMGYGDKLANGILCNENEKHDICSKEKGVDAFPAFCSMESNMCWMGLRTTCEQMAALQKLSDDEKQKQAK